MSDEDMKIVQEKPLNKNNIEENKENREDKKDKKDKKNNNNADEISESEDEINCYFRHKRCGNIELAKDLGERLGGLIIDFCFKKEAGDLLQGLEIIGEEGRYNFLEDQGRMLYIYTAEKAAKTYSPDSILRQMVIASLGDCVNDKFPEMYTRMSECRAYTIYKLCASRRGGVALYMGSAYAQMVGDKNNKNYIALGSKLYENMTAKCLEMFSKTLFIK